MDSRSRAMFCVGVKAKALIYTAVSVCALNLTSAQTVPDKLTDKLEEKAPNKVVEVPLRTTTEPSISGKMSCDSLYPSRLQGDLRASCAFGERAFTQSTRRSAQIQCRLTYGSSARATMGCLIGALIASNRNDPNGDLNQKRLACAAHYPGHTEVDLYLQESCLTGVFMTSTLGKTNPGVCREISPERSFIGPCETGVSLASEPPGSRDEAGKPLEPTKGVLSEAQPNSHNRLCDRYFDHRQLHQGYRACLNARGAAVSAEGGLTDMLGSCGQVLSDAGSDLEKAACVVGASIFRNLAGGRATNPRFQKCGDEKVSYDERHILACLTAASFLDFGDKREAEKSCKTVFYRSSQRQSRRLRTSGSAVLNYIQSSYTGFCSVRLEIDSPMISWLVTLSGQDRLRKSN